MKHTQKMIDGKLVLGVILILVSCTQAPVPASPTPGPVITFAVSSYLMKTYQPVVAEFNMKNPSITVELTQLPQTVDPREITSMADTVLLEYQSLLPANSGDYFLDLSPFEAGDPTFDATSFWPGSTNGCKSAGGRVFGLPISIEPIGIYYLEKAFDTASLPYPQPGWTWEDFQKDVNILAHTENGQPVYGFADDSFVDIPDETILSSSISYLLEQSGGEIDPASLASELGWYVDLVKSKALVSENIYPLQSPLHEPGNEAAWSEAWNKTWKSAHEMSISDPPAMWKGSSRSYYWADINLEALPDGSVTGLNPFRLIKLRDRKDIGWVPFPISAQNGATTPMDVNCGVISSGTRYPHEAWTWITYLTSYPAISLLSAAVPARPSNVDATGYWGLIQEKTRPSVEFALEHGWYSNPFKQEVLAVNRALLQSIAQGMDLQAALEQTKRQVEAVASPTP